MKNPPHKYSELSWRQVLYGYSIGIFPMGDDEDGLISWFEASPRAIMPVELPSNVISIPRSLKQVINKNIYEITVDTAFRQVINECSKRPSTWINDIIKKAYIELHKKGYGHSIEAWKDGRLAGGLYGVAYKGAFFGESMFYREPNASKIAVVKLYEILKKNKFILLDIQMMTSHFKTFGAIEISKRAYEEILERAMGVERFFKY
ncbi:MAG TPA: leucyl/phenylalanyl-tRNA--protein transferase [Ignavibacteria bacterium]|nr:leucyl/phenylalanyl-tRNA--protein transferase [Ignavibacteria bacterium]